MTDTLMIKNKQLKIFNYIRFNKYTATCFCITLSTAQYDGHTRYTAMTVTYSFYETVITS